MKTEWKTAKALLEYLNSTYSELHTAYEELFWVSYMGDHSVNPAKDEAQNNKEKFLTDEKLSEAVNVFLSKSTGSTKESLLQWKKFLDCYQVPVETKKLKQKITELETLIEKKRATRKEGYSDPVTKKFIKKSENAMRGMMVTENDELVRKALFDAMQDLAQTVVGEYVTLVTLRNEFARTVGYEDFYAYKLDLEEGMSKKELFDLWDSIYDKTNYAFQDIRALEKKEKPGLRKPWNFGFMMAGSFMKEEDPYYPFNQALTRWGQSFAALGISFKQGTLVLDLLDREGKYSNGFCHWPELVQFKAGKRIPARAQLTCNVVQGIPGQSDQGYDTLFHEGGHAAHLLNCEMKNVCVNHEFPPMSTAWAETQSMFLDTVCSSIEWQTRYAKNDSGEVYPFELFERRVRELHVTSPLGMMGIMSVCAFEKSIYEAKNLTPEKVLTIARSVSKKYGDKSESSLTLLNIPHIYSWDSSCSYQAYGLAQLGLQQWREYFFKKYGYIVDNPQIGKEMKKVWAFGSSKTFPELIKIATGKKLSATPYIKAVTRTIPASLKLAKERILTLAKKPHYTKPIDMNVVIKMVSGKDVIATNKKSFEDMAHTYATWLDSQKKH
ncbi:hypothetical protein K2Q02_01570 [Patescibacteria group bacterium]|nr:hypothetical protein [Patescibacteria group bacterium]